MGTSGFEKKQNSQLHETKKHPGNGMFLSGRDGRNRPGHMRAELETRVLPLNDEGIYFLKKTVGRG